MRRILVNPHRNSSEMRKYDQNVDSGMPYIIDWSVVVTDRSGVTAVSSAAWESEGSALLTVSGEALASDVTSAVISGASSGRGLIKCTATFDDGNTESQYIRINVHDPEVR